MIDKGHHRQDGTTPWLSPNCYDMTILAKPQPLAGVRVDEARLPGGRMARLARGLKTRLKAYRFARTAAKPQYRTS